MKKISLVGGAFALLVSACLLSACGQKGPLYLPHPKPASKPASEVASPAPASVPTPVPGAASAPQAAPAPTSN